MLVESQSDDVGAGIIGAGAAHMSVLSLSTLWLLGKGVRFAESKLQLLSLLLNTDLSADLRCKNVAL